MKLIYGLQKRLILSNIQKTEIFVIKLNSLNIFFYEKEEEHGL